MACARRWRRGSNICRRDAEQYYLCSASMSTYHHRRTVSTAPMTFITPLTASLSSSMRKIAAPAIAILVTLLSPTCSASALSSSSTSISAQHTSSSSSSELVNMRSHRRSTSHTSHWSNRKSSSIAISLPRLTFRRARSEASISAEDRAAIQERHARAAEALSVFEDRYVHASSLDFRRLRAGIARRPLRSEAELTRALRWALAHARDAYTRYLAPTELDGLRDGMTGEMCGVGIVFSAETRGWHRAKRIVIRDVVQCSPAADAGLLPGDEISAIDLAGVKNMSVDDATARLLGPRGGRVLLSFVRNGVELSVSLTRRTFSVPTVAHDVVRAQGIGHIGFLQVRDFASNTGTQARKALRDIMAEREKLRALVVDLRGNAGGLVDQAVEFAKLFLPPKSVVVLFVGRGGKVTTETASYGWRTLLRSRGTYVPSYVPIVVLVDERTASASELVAAALRENCRAVVVGARSFGKGSVQAVVPLSDGAGVAVTVAAYRTPSGKRILDGHGLRPDWFRADLADDAHAARQIFARAPERRLKWITNRLGRCSPPLSEDGIRAVQQGRRPLWFWKRVGR